MGKPTGGDGPMKEKPQEKKRSRTRPAEAKYGGKSHPKRGGGSGSNKGGNPKKKGKIILTITGKTKKRPARAKKIPAKKDREFGLKRPGPGGKRGASRQEAS